jgi:hypothetical protein
MISKTQRMNSYSNSLRLVVKQTKNMETAGEKNRGHHYYYHFMQKYSSFSGAHFKESLHCHWSQGHTWETSRTEKRKLKTFQKKKLILKWSWVKDIPWELHGRHHYLQGG